MPEIGLFLGAGPEQLPLLIRAADRGIYIIAADSNPAAVGFSIADERLHISILDYKAIVHELSGREVDFVVAMITEVALPALTRVAESLGLPKPPQLAVDCTVYKHTLRDVMSESQRTTRPKYIVADDSSPIEDARRLVGTPAVVKPSDSGGQRGLTFVTEDAQFGPAIRSAIAASRSGYGLVEEYLRGPEVNVTAVAIEGELVECVITDRIHEPDVPGVVREHVYPSTISSSQRSQVVEMIQELVKRLEIRDGILFPQLIVCDEAPVFCEFGFRMPGGVVWQLFQAVSGFDILDFQLDTARGRVKPSDQYRKLSKHDYAIVHFINGVSDGLLPGEIDHIEGLDDVLHDPSTLAADYFDKRESPRKCVQLNSGADRFFYLLVGSDTLTAARNHVVNAKDALKFVDLSGNSLNRW